MENLDIHKLSLLVLSFKTSTHNAEIITAVICLIFLKIGDYNHKMW